MEFYISPQSGQFYMINVLENQWLSVTWILFHETLIKFTCNVDDKLKLQLELYLDTMFILFSINVLLSTC